jgi:excisionase family DNA binding protein
MEDLSTFDEAAARLQVSTRTIERMVARDDLDAVRIGKRRMIVTASIEEMLRPTKRYSVAVHVCTAGEIEETFAALAKMVEDAKREALANAR